MNTLKTKKIKRPKYAVFTMDVETLSDTECLSSSGIRVQEDALDGFDEYIRILDRHDIKGTLFTVGDLAPKIADRLKKYISRGHKLAMHSHTHIAPMIESAERFRQKTRQAKQDMETQFETRVEGFRAPCFSMDRTRLDILKELGFRYDSSFLDFKKARHTVNLDLSDFETDRKGVYYKDDFYEFGLSKGKVFGMPYPISGGGYVRLSYWVFVKNLIQSYIRRNDYYVFYLHPFELTRRKVPYIKELKNYDKFYLQRGIGTFGKRVEKIIRMLEKAGYEFVTYERLVQLMDQETAK